MKKEQIELQPTLVPESWLLKEQETNLQLRKEINKLLQEQIEALS